MRDLLGDGELRFHRGNLQPETLELHFSGFFQVVEQA